MHIHSIERERVSVYVDKCSSVLRSVAAHSLFVVIVAAVTADDDDNDDAVAAAKSIDTYSRSMEKHVKAHIDALAGEKKNYARKID